MKMRKQITVVIVQIGPILKNITLEPVCCKKQQKNPNQETVLENKGPLKAVNDTKSNLND